MPGSLTSKSLSAPAAARARSQVVMNRISTRQHLVPGLLDLDEDELQEKRSPLRDPWVVFTGLAVSALALLAFVLLR